MSEASDERIEILESRLAGIHESALLISREVELNRVNRGRINYILLESMSDDVESPPSPPSQGGVKAEAGQGAVEYMSLTMLAVIVLAALALGLMAVWPKIAASLATVSLASPAAEIAPSDLLDVELNEHALAQHGEIANLAQTTVMNCKPNNLREMDGLGDYQGYKLLGCLMEDSGKLAVWVLIKDEVGNYRTITSFISRSAKYLESLIKAGRYIPVK